jgi:hypothetical protein
MLKKVINYKNEFFLNEDEKKFLIINNKKKIIRKSKKKILIQVSNKYYNLLLNRIIKLKKHSNDEFIGIFTNCINTYNNFYFFSWIIYLAKNKIYNWLLFCKWSKLYSSIGINKIYNINFISSKNKNIANTIFKRIEEKKAVLSIKYRGIVIGDLIYDSFIRYKKKPTLDIKDYYLKFLIIKSINCIDFCFSNLKKIYIKKYYTSFSSYINHGITVRYCIKIGIPVISSGSRFSFFKLLTKNDVKHIPNFNLFNRQFKKLNSKKNKILLANNLLKKKFLGYEDISSSYMNNLSYKNYKTYDEKIKLVNGVIFLHDFFDACHDFDGLLFNDFYDWTIFSLELIRKYNLKIGIKPHPNNISESKDLILKLKKEYKDLIWINPELSNYKILKAKNIKFGISATGSVLYELAYFSKIGISAGHSPTISFDISKNPKSISEYQNFLVNAHKYTNTYKSEIKKEVCKLYYMYFLNSLLHEKKTFTKINLLDIFDDNNSKKLIYYDKKINKELYI